MHGRGQCAWQGMCMVGGVHGRGACMAGGMHGGGMHGGGGVCMAGGHAWWGVCMAGGLHGRGHAWQGACMAGGVCMPCMPPPGRYYGIRSMSGGTHPTGMHSCLEIFYFPNNSKSADSFILSRNSDFGEEI